MKEWNISRQIYWLLIDVKWYDLEKSKQQQKTKQQTFNILCLKKYIKTGEKETSTKWRWKNIEKNWLNMLVTADGRIIQLCYINGNVGNEERCNNKRGGGFNKYLYKMTSFKQMNVYLIHAQITFWAKRSIGMKKREVAPENKNKNENDNLNLM